MTSAIPENISLLSPNCFKLAVSTIPNFIFFLQSVNLPPVVSAHVRFGAGRVFDYRTPGDAVDVGDITCQVLFDEDMRAYKEILNWINYNASNNGSDRIVADASLSILTNASNANHELVFHNIFPINMSELNLRTVDGPDSPLTFSVVFSFESFTFKEKTN